jgi:hypothetical protein
MPGCFPTHVTMFMHAGKNYLTHKPAATVRVCAARETQLTTSE